MVMTRLLKLKGKVHWYDNSSQEGLALLTYKKEQALVFITNSQCKFKPELNQGDLIETVYFDGIANVTKILKSEVK